MHSIGIVDNVDHFAGSHTPIVISALGTRVVPLDDARTPLLTDPPRASERRDGDRYVEFIDRLDVFGSRSLRGSGRSLRFIFAHL